MTSDLLEENQDLRKQVEELNTIILYNKKEISALNKSCDETQELLDKQIEATYKLDNENAELKAKIEKMADCSNCKHWHYSTRLLAYVCDCSDKISDSIDSRTYEHCDKWELK